MSWSLGGPNTIDSCLIGRKSIKSIKRVIHMVDLYSTGYFPKYIKVNQSEDFCWFLTRVLNYFFFIILNFKHWNFYFFIILKCDVFFTKSCFPWELNTVILLLTYEHRKDFLIAIGTFYFPKWLFAVHSIQVLFKKIAQNMDFYQKMCSLFKFQQDALSIQDT